MANFDQSTNPYAPPSSPVEPVPVANVAEPDALQQDLSRAFYAITYGTLFLPGLAYCVALVLLVKTYMRRSDFSPEHHRHFKIAAVIFLLISPLMGAALAIVWMQVNSVGK